MAKTVKIIALIFLLICPSYARVYKNGDYVMGSNALKMVEGFHKKNGRLPTSWDEVRKNYYYSDDKYLNQSMLRLGFVNPTFEIKLEENLVRVVAMDIAGIKYNISTEDLYRLLLIMNPADNSFQVVGMPEIKIRSIIADSGIDLNSYTGSTGKWMNSIELDDSTVNLLIKKSINRKDIPDQLPLSNSKKKINIQQVYIILLIALSLFVLIAFYLMRKIYLK